MSKRKAFTLIELLVVISIIALLMAILMPALAKVRAIAKAVVCRSNLKQFCVAYEMYTTTNNSFMPVGYAKLPESKLELVHPWPETLLPYYLNEDLLYCPMAGKPREYRGNNYEFGSKLKAWGDADHADLVNTCGSFGFNEFAGTPAQELIDVGWDIPAKFWRTTNLRNASNIPLLVDSGWSGFIAQHTDPPPLYDDENSGHGLKWICIDRHSGYVDATFMDSSARKVGLKELWTFEWSRTFNTKTEWTIAYYNGGTSPRTDCAAWWDTQRLWMKDFKEY